MDRSLVQSTTSSFDARLSHARAVRNEECSLTTCPRNRVKSRHLRKYRLHCRSKLELAVLWNMRQHVTKEMHFTPLPGRSGQYRRNRPLQPLVCVADHQLGAGKTAFAKTAQQLCPAFFALRINDIDPNDVPVTAGCNPIGDYHRIAQNSIIDTRFFIQRVKPQVRIFLRQRPRTELFGSGIKLMHNSLICDLERRSTPIAASTSSILRVLMPPTKAS